MAGIGSVARNGMLEAHLAIFVGLQFPSASLTGHILPLSMVGIRQSWHLYKRQRVELSSRAINRSISFPVLPC